MRGQQDDTYRCRIPANYRCRRHQKILVKLLARPMNSYVGWSISLFQQVQDARRSLWSVRDAAGLSGPIGSSNRGLTPVRCGSRRCQAAAPTTCGPRPACIADRPDTSRETVPDPIRASRRGPSPHPRDLEAVRSPRGPDSGMRRARGACLGDRVEADCSRAPSSVATLSWRATRRQPRPRDHPASRPTWPATQGDSQREPIRADKISSRPRFLGVTLPAGA